MKTVALCLTIAAGAAHAQYKCTGPGGAVTFQQAPCASGATGQKMKISVAPPDQGQPGTFGAELCAAEAARFLGLTDPEDRRVAAVRKGPAEVIQYAGQPLVAHQFIMLVGGRPYVCFTSEDERRVLKVVTPSQARMPTTEGAPRYSGATGLSSNERQVVTQQPAPAYPRRYWINNAASSPRGPNSR